jgi:hypothetical protein
MKLPRLTLWILICVALIAGVIVLYPPQLPVIISKLLFVALAGVVGYYLDRSLFPYARPDGYLAHPLADRYGLPPQVTDADYQINTGYERVFAAALIRRALIIGAAMPAIGLGS